MQSSSSSYSPPPLYLPRVVLQAGQVWVTWNKNIVQYKERMFIFASGDIMDINSPARLSVFAWFTRYSSGGLVFKVMTFLDAWASQELVVSVTQSLMFSLLSPPLQLFLLCLTSFCNLQALHPLWLILTYFDKPHHPLKNCKTGTMPKMLNLLKCQIAQSKCTKMKKWKRCKKWKFASYLKIT